MSTTPGLVSVLIPTYNRPELSELALQSVLAQTYQNIEIIICDDSTDLSVYEKLKPLISKDSRIKYIKNEENLHIKNYDKCYDMASGEYINFLMDDDLFHKTKIEKMVAKLEEHKDAKLVTSAQLIINKSGELIYKKPFPRGKKFQKNRLFSGVKLGDYTLSKLINCLGEPTTVLFRKKDVQQFRRFNGKEYTYLSDLATWMELLSQGNAVYIAEVLSYFRSHRNQMQKDPAVLIPGMKEWLDLIRDSRRRGFLAANEDYRDSLENLLDECEEVKEQALKSGYEKQLIKYDLDGVMEKVKKKLKRIKI